jgi:hypothetical protein
MRVIETFTAEQIVIAESREALILDTSGSKRNVVFGSPDSEGIRQ